MTAPPTSRWGRWRALSPLQRRTVVVAWWLLPLVWLALWSFGLPRLRAWLTRRAMPRSTQAVTLDDAGALGRAVNIAADLSPFPVTCLTRSLLLEWWLRRKGVPSDLRIGVQLRDGAFRAHAWVECVGVPVNDRMDIALDFLPFDDFGHKATFDR